MTVNNADIAKKIAEDALIYRGIRRSDVVLQIRQHMVRKGIKNSDIAERLGVSEANVSRWLKGNQNIQIDTLYLLADAIEESLSLHVGSSSACMVEDAVSWEDGAAIFPDNVYLLKEYSKKQSPKNEQAEDFRIGARNEYSEAVA
jgi:transcriptional regulator with XRE-family HTH domain